MRNYLRNPEFVVNTLVLITGAFHWRDPWVPNLNSLLTNDNTPRFEALITKGRIDSQKEESHEETDLPAKGKTRTPRAMGQVAMKISISAGNSRSNAYPEPPPLPFTIGLPQPQHRSHIFDQTNPAIQIINLVAAAQATAQRLAYFHTQNLQRYPARFHQQNFGSRGLE